MISQALTLLLAGTVAVSAADDKGPLGVHLTTAVVAERIPLTPLRGSIEMVADPLGARIELRTDKPQPALAAQVARHAGEICANVTVTGAVIALHCRTRRFEAVLNSEGSQRFLDIQELRGLPWRDGPGGPPAYHYEPMRVGLGSPCPGASPVARGECALLIGKTLEAATQFRVAIEGYDRQMAALRLGDMALRTGDPATAIGWYRRAGVAGSFGRMARTRVCEIEGTCLASTEIVRRIFDAKGLPDPVRAEMTIRGVRAEAFSGRMESATNMMWQQIRHGSLAWVCREGGEIVCRRVLLQAMREAVLVEPAAGERAVKGKGTPDKNKSESVVGASASSATDKVPAVVGNPDGGAAVDAGRVADGAADAGGKVVVRPGNTVALAASKAPARGERAAGESKEVPAVDELTPDETLFEVYLALPRWDHGPLAPELSEAAADLARHMRAPVFGGNILSAVAPEVGVAELPDHLFHAADLYFEGDDLARARLVIEYARTRIGTKMSARWAALERKIAARAAADDEAAAEPEPNLAAIDPEAIARELSAARAASARARAARADNAPKKQGDKP